MKFRSKKVITFFSIATILIGAVWYFRTNCFIDHNEGIWRAGYRTGVEGGLGKSRIVLAKHEVGSYPWDIVRLISSCRMFPDNMRDYFERISGHWEAEGKTREERCARREFVMDFNGNKPENPELHYPWIDPWGRPYQIRYDLERGKLQVKSRGRYLWWPWDDIVGETPFVTKDYPKDGMPLYVEMLNHCKKVPKDDMSCVFNRGWH